MPVKITTLSENTVAEPDLLAEWGLSVLVQADRINVLLDTGASVSLLHNLENLNVKRIDKIVLSHGHYDHTGGLKNLLGKMKQEVEIIAHPDIWSAKYSHRRGKADKYIGMPFIREELENLGARFNLTSKPVKISENIMTTGEISVVTDFESIDSELCVREGKSLVADKLADDQALIIKTKKGLIVVAGCAHRGILNTLYHARKITGVENVYMVLGGCHLIHAAEERIWMTIATLKELGVQKVGVSHCTGMPASIIFAQEFGENFFFNNAGTVTRIS